MNITVKTEADVTILLPDGRLDWTTIAVFSSAIKQAIRLGARKILLDFSLTDYMGSAGVRAMIDVMREVESAKGKLILCSLNDNLKELFHIVQFDKVFTIFEKDSEALDAFQ
ncbi:MAG: anti-sigma factor antagonist [Candidatus Omnitrophota bacterium]|jgi:anti-anti-sigma factor|nr:MAG: anti-sigma factor antagonist [Candidatus Omnitrophota bacterium]